MLDFLLTNRRFLRWGKQTEIEWNEHTTNFLSPEKKPLSIMVDLSGRKNPNTLHSININHKHEPTVKQVCKSEHKAFGWIWRTASRIEFIHFVRIVLRFMHYSGARRKKKTIMPEHFQHKQKPKHIWAKCIFRTHGANTSFAPQDIN